MKTLIILLAILISTCMTSDQTNSDQMIHQGQLVNVSVEKVLYHAKRKENFFLKFKIENLSNRIIGLDLTNYWKVIYPNQWGIYKKPYREIIDEERMIPDTVINEVQLIDKYNNQRLTFIKPNETIEYYRDWNGSGEKVELADKNSFLIITVDGQLLLTDGKTVAQIRVGDDEDKRAIIFKYPITDRYLPEEALIIHKN